MVTSTRCTESVDEARVRLAQKARDVGVKLYCDNRDGRHYATSASKPGERYYVTAFSYTCPGFFSHQRCKHNSALLASLGGLEDASPTPNIGPKVFHVDGYYTLASEPEWTDPCSTIAVDGIETVRITGDTYNLSVWWLQDGKPIDDMTGCIDPRLNHREAVVYWLQSIDAAAPVDTPCQDAGLFDAAEVLDEIHLVAA